MTLLRNDASGGIDGTSVTTANSGTATADAFTQIVTGANSHLWYWTVDDVKCIEAATRKGNSGYTAEAGWTLPNWTRVAGRVELFLPSPGPTDYKFQTTGSGFGCVWRFLFISGSSNWQAQFRVDARDNGGPGGAWRDTRQYLRINAGGHDLVFDQVMRYDQWWRIEFDFTTVNPGGSYDIRLYEDRYTTTPFASYSGPKTWSNSGPVNDFRVGALEPLTYDDIGWVGNYVGTVAVSNDGVLPALPTEPEPPDAALLSTLTDTFDTISGARWVSGGIVANPDNTVRFGNSSNPLGALTAVNTYEPDYSLVQVTVPATGDAEMVWRKDADYARIAVHREPGGTSYVRASWQLGAVTGDNRIDGLDVPYDPQRHAWLRIDRYVDAELAPTQLTFSTSSDGESWEQIAATGAVTATFDPVSVELSGTDGVVVDSFNVPASPVTTPQVPGDPFDPGAIAPAIGDELTTEPTCETVLNLIRKFSTETKRAVRIVGPSAIEMVDPAELPPAGYNSWDSVDMYHSVTRTFKAGTDTLSALAGDVQAELSAELVNDDIRVALSGLRLPQPLPVPELGAAPVKRLTLTFTPKHCTGSLEFHVRSVPLQLLR